MLVSLTQACYQFKWRVYEFQQIIGQNLLVYHNTVATMAEHPENFKKIINQKLKRFQWGAAQSKLHTTQRQSIQECIKQSVGASLDQAPLQARANFNSQKFQNLPIKESEIISPHLKQDFDSFKNIKQTQNNFAVCSTEAKQTFHRLNELKNEFQILRGTLIDSKILEGDRKYDKVSDLSKSNVGSTSKQALKTGEAIRAKDKISRKSKISSSSVSQKDLSGRQNGQFNLKVDTNSMNSAIKGKKYIQYQKQDLLQRSKNSNKSDKDRNKIQREHSRDSCRIEASRELKKGEFLSTSLLGKHSLQLKLRDSLEKLQVLLQNEIVLKNKINQLQQQLKNYRIQPEKRHHEEEHCHNYQKLLNYEKIVEEYRAEVRELIQTKARLQADLMEQQSLNQILKEQKNRQLSQIMNHKISYANLQLENKRLQMITKMQKKNLQFEIQRLTIENQIYKSNGTISQITKAENLDSYKEKIKILELELEEKEKKNRQALEQAQKRKILNEQNEFLQMIEDFHNRRKSQKQGQNELSKQLAGLKEQLFKIKREVSLSQSQLGFESKVISLEEALKRDNQQKQKHLAQIEHFQKLYEDLKQKYKKCEEKLEVQTERYLEATKKFKLDIEEAGDFKFKYQTTVKQNEILSAKLNQLQMVIKNHDDVYEQLARLKLTIKKQEDSHCYQLKDAKKRVDMIQFEAFKKVEESKMTVDLAKKQFQSHVSVLNGQLLALSAELDFCRNQITCSKEENERLKLKISELEFSKEPKITIQNHLKIEEKESLKREYQEEKTAMKRIFVAEQQKLAEQVVTLTKINQQMSENIGKIGFLQTQNDELRVLCKRKVSSESIILHLWDIKQVQYSNINQILKHFKDSGQTRIFGQGQLGKKDIAPQSAIPSSIQVNSRIIKTQINNQVPAQLSFKSTFLETNLNNLR